MSQGARVVLFDLDGTLTDPFVGITSSIQYALAKMGRLVPSADDLRWCIGPPLQDSFKTLLNTDDEAVAWEGVAHYRERYSSVGLFENTVYDGIPAALQALQESGRKLSLATSKPLVQASRIVEHFGLSTYFDALHGSELDGARSRKGELIAYILSEHDWLAADAIMVGDREHDVLGAQANNVATIAVSYGYGSMDELRAHRPDFICASPADIVQTILANAA